MKTDNLEKQVKLLSVLVDGCKKHPANKPLSLCHLLPSQLVFVFISHDQFSFH